MNTDKLFEIMIMLLSTGTLGVVINAIQKARDRKSDDRINRLIRTTTEPLLFQVEKMNEKIGIIVDDLKNLNSKVNKQEQNIKKLTNDVNMHARTSRKVDMILTKSLHDNHLINGESEKIYSILIEEAEQEKRESNG